MRKLVICWLFLLFILSCNRQPTPEINNNSSGMPERLDSLTRALDSVNKDINSLSGVVSRQMGEIESMKVTQDNLSIRLEKTKKDVSELSGRLDSLESKSNVPEPGRKVYRVPPGLDETGITDVSEEMQTFLNSVADSSTILFPRPVVYRAEAGLRLYGKKDVIIKGNGSTIIANDTLINVELERVRGEPYFIVRQNHGDSLELKIWYTTPHLFPRVRPHFKIIESENIVIDGLNIRGANPGAGTSTSGGRGAFEAQHAFEISRSKNVTIQNCEASYVWGDLGYIGGSDNSSFVDCNFHHSGRQGITIISGKDNLIKRCTLSHIRRSAIDIEPNVVRNTVDGFTVDSCYFGPTRLLWIANGGPRDATVRNIYITNNTVRRGGIVVKGSATNKRGPYYILNNELKSTGGKRMGRIENATFVQLRGNKVRLQWSVPNEVFKFIGVDSFHIEDNYLYAERNGKIFLGPHRAKSNNPYYQRGLGRINPKDSLEWMSAHNIVDNSGYYLTDSVYTTRDSLYGEWKLYGPENL